VAGAVTRARARGCVLRQQNRREQSHGDHSRLPQRGHMLAPGFSQTTGNRAPHGHEELCQAHAADCLNCLSDAADKAGESPAWAPPRRSSRQRLSVAKRTARACFVFTFAPAAPLQSWTRTSPSGGISSDSAPASSGVPRRRQCGSGAQFGEAGVASDSAEIPSARLRRRDSPY